MSTRAIVYGGAACVAALLVGLALFLAIMKRETAGAPDYRVTPVGGIQYEEMDAHPIDLHNKVDRGLVTGLPARERRDLHGDILYGTFISLANTSTRPLHSATQIELRDEDGHQFRPLALPLSNPYVYVPRVVGPGSRVPAQGSQADANLAAAGRLLLFKIPATLYKNGGVLELQIHQAGATRSLIV